MISLHSLAGLSLKWAKVKYQKSDLKGSSTGSFCPTDMRQKTKENSDPVMGTIREENKVVGAQKSSAVIKTIYDSCSVLGLNKLIGSSFKLLMYTWRSGSLSGSGQVIFPFKSL